MPDPVTARSAQPLAVIFDFDDTLANSLPARVAALQRCLSDHLARPVSAVEATQTINSAPYIDDQLRWLLGEDPAIPSLVQAYRHHYYHPERAPLEAFEGVRDALSALERQRVSLALVTSRYRTGAAGNPQWSVVHELERMGLSKYFTAIVGFEDTEGHKPSPEPFLLGCRLLGVAPARVLAVGDTPFDIAGARDAGAVSAAALWGTADPSALLAASPDVVLAAPSEVLVHL